MNLALRLNFQSRCSNFHPTLFPNIPILRSFLFSITFARHIRPRESLREKIRISRKNINLLHSLEISNGFKNRSPFSPLVLRIKKGQREREKARLTERIRCSVEFGYRAFRRRSLLNKSPPTRARCFDNEKARLFGANHALNTFLPPLPFVHGIVFPLLLSLLGYFLFSPLRYSDREIHCEKLPGIKGSLLPQPFHLFHARLPSSSRTDRHILDLVSVIFQSLKNRIN